MITRPKYTDFDTPFRQCSSTVHTYYTVKEAQLHFKEQKYSRWFIEEIAAVMQYAKLPSDKWGRTSELRGFMNCYQTTTAAKNCNCFQHANIDHNNHNQCPVENSLTVSCILHQEMEKHILYYRFGDQFIYHNFYYDVEYILKKISILTLSKFENIDKSVV